MEVKGQGAIHQIDEWEIIGYIKIILIPFEVFVRRTYENQIIVFNHFSPLLLWVAFLSSPVAFHRIDGKQTRHYSYDIKIGPKFIGLVDTRNCKRNQPSATPKATEIKTEIFFLTVHSI